MESNLVFNKNAVDEILNMTNSILSLNEAVEEDPETSLMVEVVYREDYETLLDMANYVSNYLGVVIITEPDEEFKYFKIWIVR